MKKAVFIFILLTALFSSLAAASYISLNTSVNTKFENGVLKLSVGTVNKGDESAYNVQAELKVGEKSVLAEKKSELPIDGAYQADVTFKPVIKKPGTYPLFLILHYTDANQYPFSALSAQTFIYQKEAVAPIFGQLKSTSFSKEGSLQLVLKNLGDNAIETKTSIVAPRELSIINNGEPIMVPSKGEAAASFNIKNFSALAGSTYQVFAVSESEDNDLHYTSIAPGTIKIVAAQEVFGLGYPLVFTLLALLIIVFIGTQFINRK